MCGDGSSKSLKAVSTILLDRECLFKLRTRLRLFSAVPGKRMVDATYSSCLINRLSAPRRLRRRFLSAYADMFVTAALPLGSAAAYVASGV